MWNLKTTISSPPKKKQKQTHINRMCVFVYAVASTLCDLRDCTRLPRPWIFQTRILEWAAISSSRGLPNPRVEPESSVSPAMAGRFFTTSPHGKPQKQNRLLVIRDRE